MEAGGIHAPNDGFLSLGTVDQDLRPLRGYCRGPQILPQQTNFCANGVLQTAELEAKAIGVSLQSPPQFYGKGAPTTGVFVTEISKLI